MERLVIRPFRDADAAEAAQLFFDAVHEGSAGFHDAAQRRAWAAEIPATVRWQERLGSQITFVAEVEGAMVGYMTLDHAGYIDLAYVAPQVMGKGVADAFYARIEATARDFGLSRLCSEASHLARGFFLRRRWLIQEEQVILRHGVTLRDFQMFRALD